MLLYNETRHNAILDKADFILSPRLHFVTSAPFCGDITRVIQRHLLQLESTIQLSQIRLIHVHSLGDADGQCNTARQQHSGVTKLIQSESSSVAQCRLEYCEV